MHLTRRALGPHWHEMGTLKDLVASERSPRLLTDRQRLILLRHPAITVSGRGGASRPMARPGLGVGKGRNHSTCGRLERLGRTERDEPSTGTTAAVDTVHSSDDCSTQCATGAQPALSLRFRPQVQTLPSGPGQRRSGSRTGQSRSSGGRGCGFIRGQSVSAGKGADQADSPALEGRHVPRLRPAQPHAAQSRRQLNDTAWSNPRVRQQRVRI